MSRTSRSDRDRRPSGDGASRSGLAADANWDAGREIVLDHGSPMPLYYQVASQLEEAIENELLPAGARLDNEIDLAHRLGLSRPTVRQAIQLLVDKGLLARKRGVGTQVVHNRVQRPLELSSLYDDLAELDQRPSTRVLDNSVEPATAEIADILGIAEGEDVISLQRVRYARDEPIARMGNWLPAAVLRPGSSELEETGLYQLLRTSGVRLRSARQMIGARTAESADAELLSEPVGAALLTMQRTTFNDMGRVVEYGSHVYRASRYTFDLSLRADQL